MCHDRWGGHVGCDGGGRACAWRCAPVVAAVACQRATNDSTGYGRGLCVPGCVAPIYFCVCVAVDTCRVHPHERMSVSSVCCGC